jgi:hypothetical protein
MHLHGRMRDTKRPTRRHGGERKTDQIGQPDEAGVGRKGGADIDIEKREKELESGKK